MSESDSLLLLPTQEPGPGPTDAPLATYQSYSAYTTSAYLYTTTITRIAYDSQGINAPTQLLQTKTVSATSIGYKVVYRPLLYTGPIPAPPLGTLFTTTGKILSSATQTALAPTATASTKNGNTDQKTASPTQRPIASVPVNTGTPTVNQYGSKGVLTPSTSPSPIPTSAPTSIPNSNSINLSNAAISASLESIAASQASIAASKEASSASLASISAFNAAQSTSALLASISASNAMSFASVQSSSANSLSTSIAQFNNTLSASLPIATPTHGTNGATPTHGTNGDGESSARPSDLSNGQIAGIVVGSNLALLLILLLCLLCCRRRRNWRRNDGEEAEDGAFAIIGRNISHRFPDGLSRRSKTDGAYAALGLRAAEDRICQDVKSDALEEEQLSGNDGSGFIDVRGRRLEGASRASVPTRDVNAKTSTLIEGLAGLAAGLAVRLTSKKVKNSSTKYGNEWDHEEDDDDELDRMIASDEDLDIPGERRGLMNFDIGQDTSEMAQAGPSDWLVPASLIPGHTDEYSDNQTSPSKSERMGTGDDQTRFGDVGESTWLANLGATTPSISTPLSTSAGKKSTRQSPSNTDFQPNRKSSSFNSDFGDGNLGLIQGLQSESDPFLDMALTSGAGKSSLEINYGESNRNVNLSRKSKAGVHVSTIESSDSIHGALPYDRSVGLDCMNEFGIRTSPLSRVRAGTNTFITSDSAIVSLRSGNGSGSNSGTRSGYGSVHGAALYTSSLRSFSIPLPFSTPAASPNVDQEGFTEADIVTTDHVARHVEGFGLGASLFTGLFPGWTKLSARDEATEVRARRQQSPAKSAGQFYIHDMRDEANRREEIHSQKASVYNNESTYEHDINHGQHGQSSSYEKSGKNGLGITSQNMISARGEEDREEVDGLYADENVEEEGEEFEEEMAAGYTTSVSNLSHAHSSMYNGESTQSRRSRSTGMASNDHSNNYTDSSNSSNIRQRQERYQESSGSTGAASYNPSYLARQITTSTTNGSSNVSSREVAKGGSSSSSYQSRRRRRQEYTDGLASGIGRKSKLYNQEESDAQSSRATAGEDQRMSIVDPGLQSVQEGGGEEEEEEEFPFRVETNRFHPSESIGAAVQRIAAREISEELRGTSWRPSPRVESLSQRAAANLYNEDSIIDAAPLFESEESKCKDEGRGLLDRFLRP